MRSEKFKYGLRGWEMFLIILAIFLLIFLLFRLIKYGKLTTNQNLNPEPEPEPEPETELITDEDIKISNFYKTVVETLPEMPENMQSYLTAQAMHETGIFTSPLFLEHNNAFGMKYPVKRQTTATAQTESGYAHYDSVSDSIKDIQLYFEALNYPETFDNVTEYISTAKSKGYFEAPLKTYSNAVNKHLKRVMPFAQ